MIPSPKSFDSSYLLIATGGILFLISLVLPGISVPVGFGGEEPIYKTSSTIHLFLFIITKIQYKLIVNSENTYFAAARIFDSVCIILTILNSFWHVTFLLIGKRIILPFFSLFIILFCLLVSILTTSQWDVFLKFKIGFGIWTLGYIITTIGVGINCYNKILKRQNG